MKSRAYMIALRASTPGAFDKLFRNSRSAGEIRRTARARPYAPPAGAPYPMRAASSSGQMTATPRAVTDERPTAPK